MTSQHTQHEQNSSKREEDLKMILGLLNNRVDDLKDELLISCALLDQGVKTKLSSEIEKTIENPLAALLGVKSDIDFNFEKLVDSIIKRLLSLKKGTIKEAYRTKLSDHNLHYCIVLANDTFENREDVFSLLDIYDNNGELSKHYPVDFQFVPVELADKINYTERIEL